MSKQDAYNKLDIRAALSVQGFGGPHANSQLSDPVVRTRISLTLEQLHPYNHNPRSAPNPLFAEIKSSIRARGLDNPPAVSRRPGEEFYVIINGGNTRLQVLNELYQETGDNRFFVIECDFVPWVSDVQALTGHLIENDVRGQMIFLDRALALEKLRSFYEAERGIEVSLREFSEILSSAGYPIAVSQLSRMFQSLNVLYPAIPIALHTGLGRPQVEKLLRFRTACAEIWRAAGRDEPQFQLLFESALQSADAPEWHYEVAHRNVVEELAIQLGAQVQDVINAVEAGNIELLMPPVNCPSAIESQAAPIHSAPHREESSRAGDKVAKEPAALHPMTIDRKALQFIETAARDCPPSLASARALLAAKAGSFSAMLPKINLWIETTPNAGVGFLLRDTDDPTFANYEHAAACAEVYCFLKCLTGIWIAEDTRSITPLNIFFSAEWDERTAASALAMLMLARFIYLKQQQIEGHSDEH